MMVVVFGLVYQNTGLTGLPGLFIGLLVIAVQIGVGQQLGKIR